MDDGLRREVEAIEARLRSAPDADGLSAAYAKFAAAAETEFSGEHDRLVARRAALLFLDACREPRTAAPLDLDAEAAALLHYVKENAGHWWRTRTGWVATYEEVQRIKAEFRAHLARAAEAGLSER